MLLSWDRPEWPEVIGQAKELPHLAKILGPLPIIDRLNLFRINPNTICWCNVLKVFNWCLIKVTFILSWMEFLCPQDIKCLSDMYQGLLNNLGEYKKVVNVYEENFLYVGSEYSNHYSLKCFSGVCEFECEHFEIKEPHWSLKCYLSATSILNPALIIPCIRSTAQNTFVLWSYSKRLSTGGIGYCLPDSGLTWGTVVYPHSNVPLGFVTTLVVVDVCYYGRQACSFVRPWAWTITWDLLCLVAIGVDQSTCGTVQRARA